MQTLNFNLYDMSGELHMIGVDGETVDAALANYDQMRSALEYRGFSFDKPDPRAIPVSEHIIGYVMGEAFTKDKAGTQKCVYLYNDIQAFTYKSVTVYEPQFDDLPLGDMLLHKVWGGEPGAAPSRATAATKGYMYPCNFMVVMKPTIDFKTGAPMVKIGPNGKEYTPKKYLKVSKVLKYPYRSFESPDQAAAWAVRTKLFPSAGVAFQEYESLKETVRPKKADEMWKAWVDKINGLLDDDLE